MRGATDKLLQSTPVALRPLVMPESRFGRVPGPRLDHGPVCSRRPWADGQTQKCLTVPIPRLGPLMAAAPRGDLEVLLAVRGAQRWGAGKVCPVAAPGARTHTSRGGLYEGWQLSVLLTLRRGPSSRAPEEPCRRVPSTWPEAPSLCHLVDLVSPVSAARLPGITGRGPRRLALHPHSPLPPGLGKRGSSRS